jgi:hypothetical protein
VFYDLRDQCAPWAWLALRACHRSLLVQGAGGTITMVRPGVLDHAPACLERLECRRRLRWTPHAMPSGFGALVPAKGGSGSQFFAEGVPCGLAHVRRPGESLPGQPGTKRCWTTLGGGTASATKTWWSGALSTMMRACDGRGGSHGSAHHVAQGSQCLCP